MNTRDTRNVKENFWRHVDELPKSLRRQVRSYVSGLNGRRVTVGELSGNGITLIKKLRDKKVPFRAIEAALGLKLRNGNNAFVANNR